MPSWFQCNWWWSFCSSRFYTNFSSTFCYWLANIYTFCLNRLCFFLKVYSTITLKQFWYREAISYLFCICIIWSVATWYYVISRCQRQAEQLVSDRQSSNDLPAKSSITYNAQKTSRNVVNILSNYTQIIRVRSQF